MKLLLIAINAKYIHTNPAVYSIRDYINEKLKLPAAGPHSVQIAEYTINDPAPEILADIYARKPDVAAFSCYIWNWEIIRRLLMELPKILPAAALWLGGPEVSYDGEEILKRYPAVKGIVLGEGERTCTELFSRYGDPAPDFSQIKGIIYRDGDGAIFRAAAREPMDLNDLPFSFSALSGADLQNRIIYYESSRGCPYRCSYCLSAADRERPGQAKAPRFKDSEKVKADLALILAHEVAQIKFVDRTFNCNHAHAMAIWQFIRAHDNGVTNFHFEIAADLLTAEEISLLGTFRPGLLQLEIGVQTTNAPTLKSINRRMNLPRLKEAVTALKQNRNIRLHLDLIAGLPYEDYDAFVSSFNEIYELKPDNLQLGFLKILPGAPIRQEASELGIIYETSPPYQVLYTKWLTYPEMRRLRRVEEMTEIFFNSKQFMNTMAVLARAFKSPFQMYEKLADFFAEKDYFRKSPARAYRYQALLDFAAVSDPQNEDCYRELLTHDLYLREKAAYPDFAPDLSPYRARIKAILRAQPARMTAVCVFHYHVDAENAEEKLRRSDEPRFIRYDYQKRDALTKNARIENVGVM